MENNSIRPQEKIGVAGRTGAGKSTLAACLYRLLEMRKGMVQIDGLDIGQLSLQRLRSSLSMIPQDPVLFVGTIRYNLDPFDAHTDEELWQALGKPRSYVSRRRLENGRRGPEHSHFRDLLGQTEKTHMKAAVSALPKGLASEVVENGENFSVSWWK